MPQVNSIAYSGAAWTSLFASAPITGDEVNVGTDGSQAITTSLDQSAVDLDALTFQHPSRLRIGSAAGPLKYELSGPLRWDQRGGWLYFEISTSAAPRIVCGGPNLNLVGGGTSTLIEMTDRGGLFVSEDVTLTAVNFYGASIAEIEAKSGDDFSVLMLAGQLTSRRNMTTVDVTNATLIAEGGAVTATTITARHGSNIQWDGGAITTLNAYTGCVFDATMSSVPFTISTMNIADGADVRLPPWVTVTTTNYLGRRATV